MLHNRLENDRFILRAQDKRYRFHQAFENAFQRLLMPLNENSFRNQPQTDVWYVGLAQLSQNSESLLFELAAEYAVKRSCIDSAGF